MKDLNERISNCSYTHVIEKAKELSKNGLVSFGPKLNRLEALGQEIERALELGVERTYENTLKPKEHHDIEIENLDKTGKKPGRCASKREFTEEKEKLERQVYTKARNYGQYTQTHSRINSASLRDQPQVAQVGSGVAANPDSDCSSSLSSHLHKKHLNFKKAQNEKHPTIFEVQSPRIMEYSQYRSNDRAERELKLLEIGPSKATKEHIKRVVTHEN